MNRPLDSRFTTHCKTHNRWMKHFLISGGGSLLACEKCLESKGHQVEHDRLWSEVTLRIRAGFEKEPSA